MTEHGVGAAVGDMEGNLIELVQLQQMIFSLSI